MDKKLLVTAIQGRIGKKLEPYEVASLDMALFVAQYHPELTGASVERLAELLTCQNFYSTYEIGRMLEVAVTAAKELGYPVEERESLTTRYQVAFGLCVNVRPKTINEVYRAVYSRLRGLNLIPDEGFSIWCSVRESDPFPQGRWVAAYGVTGGSEGHWLHVGVVDQHGEKWATDAKVHYIEALVAAGVNEADAPRLAGAILNLEQDEDTIVHLFLGKTLLEGNEGMEFIYKVATEIAKMMA